MSEKLCLKWNDFQANLNSAFGGLRGDEDFCDVTLACEDGQQIEAHKVILAASSPFFQTLLRRNKHPHPLIFMRGVKSEDLVAIVDFLYYGEANVYQENIEAFLALAEDLDLKGLRQNKNNEITEEEIDSPEVTIKSDKSKLDREVLQTKISKPERTEKVERTVALTDYEVATINISDIKELDEKVKSLMVRSQNMTPDGRQKADICTVCGKEGKNSNIMDHIEAKHLEGVSIPCGFCEKSFRSRNGLRHHKYSFHKA